MKAGSLVNRSTSALHKPDNYNPIGGCYRPFINLLIFFRFVGYSGHDTRSLMHPGTMEKIALEGQ